MQTVEEQTGMPVDVTKRAGSSEGNHEFSKILTA